MNVKTNSKKFLIIVLAILINTGNANVDFTFGKPVNL